jgi:hypothetical protein
MAPQTSLALGAWNDDDACEFDEALRTQRVVDASRWR